MESSLLNTCCGKYVVFLLWSLRCGVFSCGVFCCGVFRCGVVVVEAYLVVESLLWDRCCGIFVVE